MGSTAINDSFQKHLLDEGMLHYGEFVNNLSRLIVSSSAPLVHLIFHLSLNLVTFKRCTSSYPFS